MRVCVCRAYFPQPWCGHCKHIAPIYEEAATALLGKMSFGASRTPTLSHHGGVCTTVAMSLRRMPRLTTVLPAGEVDATANGVLKTRFGITGYPTIKFMRDGTVQEYNYPRTVEGFVGFAERMNGACAALPSRQLVVSVCTCLTAVVPGCRAGPAVHRLGTLSRVQAFTRDPEHPVTFIFAKVAAVLTAAVGVQCCPAPLAR